MDEDQARVSLFDVTIAEFNALRAEIDRRSAAQERLFVLNLAIAGAVGGVLAKGELAPGWDVRLLYLILPAVTPALALGWWDHAQNIAELGEHIRADVRTAVAVLSHPHQRLADHVLRWEGKPHPRSTARWASLGLQLLVPFVMFPVASLFAVAIDIGWNLDTMWFLVASFTAFTALATWRLVAFLLASVGTTPRSG